jgi:hypothetical protein
MIIAETATGSTTVSERSTIVTPMIIPTADVMSLVFIG